MAEYQGARGMAGMQTCCHRSMGRNLVVCIDGTSKQFGVNNSNVIKLYNLILKTTSDNQKTWYNSGIGTYARSSVGILYHKVDQAVALDFERNVLGAYRWLSDNYEDGDRIFLFGFSRGAYQIRVLSAMIDKVGLIHKGNEMQIPFAYELYVNPDTDCPSTATAFESHGTIIPLAQLFKDTFSHKGLKVHFVGAWDTVSSVGIAGGVQMLPRTIDGMRHVCYFRHALALDERRVMFLPEYAHRARSMAYDDSPVLKKVGPQVPQTLEVWFAGTHSDIGGGNIQNEGIDPSLPPLRWMVSEAQAVGLRMASFNQNLYHEELIEVQESLTWPWWPLEFLPLKRPSFTRRYGGNQVTRKPHLGSVRKIHPGQKIHSSVLLCNKVYNPKARPPEGDPTFWERLRTEEDFRREWIELDLIEHVENVMNDFIVDPDNASPILCSMAVSSEGQRAVYVKGIEALERINEPFHKCRLLEILIDIAQENSRSNSQFERLPLNNVQHLISDLLKSEEYQRTVKEFISLFTDRCINVLRGHKAQVNSVAFSPNGKFIVSASDDDTVRIWNAETWAQIHELSAHLFMVSAVSIFPDSRHVVSGSWDNTLCVWDVETGTQVGEPWKGHEDCVTSVAVSPDGQQVASGSRDKTVRIWDVETRKQLAAPFRAQTGSIHSVAYSPDGNYIASGSNDNTICIWDLRRCKQIGKLSQEHEDLVTSVSFSPDFDGHLVASSSADCTIRMFDSQTGGPKGQPFRGHGDVVWSVIFSPDGELLASGSSDHTVRVWDVKTGRQLGEPLQGHTGGVRSVAFSPDGEWIVSGSSDYTIRIWFAG